MADILFDHGLDEWRTWTTGAFVWLALQTTYTPSKADRFVDDVVAHEASTSGYARDTVANPTRTVDTTGHKITYNCDNPDLGSPAAGETLGYVALARVVNDDTDSILLACYAIPEFTTAGLPLVPVIDPAGVHYLNQGS